MKIYEISKSPLFEISKAEKKRQKSTANQQKLDATQQERDAENKLKSDKLAQITQMRADAQALDQQLQQQKVDQQKKLDQQLQQQKVDQQSMYDLLDDMRDGDLSHEDFDDGWISVKNHVSSDDELLRALIYVSEGTWNYSVMVQDESPEFKQRFFQELAKRRAIGDLIYVLQNNNTSETANDLAYAFDAIKGMDKKYISRVIAELANSNKWKTIDAISKLQLSSDIKDLIAKTLIRAEQTYVGGNLEALARAINKFQDPLHLESTDLSK